jgi:hypothetical protein
MLSGECHDGFSLSANGLHLPAELREVSCSEQCRRQAEGVRHTLYQGQSLAHGHQRLVRITKRPQNPGEIDLAVHPGVTSIEKGMGAVLLGMIEHYSLLQMDSG